MNGQMRAIRRIAIVSGSVLAVAIIAYVVLVLVGGSVTFSDAGLERAVRNALQVEDGRIYLADIEQITHLDGARFEIRDLSDIQLLSNVRSLDLSGNPIESLRPLNDLERLEDLRLADTDLESTDQLQLTHGSGSPSLVALDLQNNRELRDIQSLRQLSTLRELSLRNTAVDNLSAIGELTALRALDLRETPLAEVDLTPLRRLTALERLNLRETGVRDVAVLHDLAGLRYLNLHSNAGIESLEPLRGLRRLQTLILRNVPVGDAAEVLSGMRRLQRVNLRNTGISDLSVVADLMRRGALQDDPERGINAEVDIRDNPVRGTGEPTDDRDGYELLKPYWNRISRRQPEELPRTPSQALVISEVMTSNGETAVLQEDRFPDWIELHNPGDSPADISGYYLSRDPQDLREWQFPAGTSISAGGYLVLIASREREDLPADSEALRVPFNLSSEGETISLTGERGRTIIDQLTVPAIPRNTSFGRSTDSDSRGGATAAHTYLDPTPGQANEGARRYVDLQFSHRTGYYDTPFRLTLSTAEAGVEIYYTLDGSTPDPSAVEDSGEAGTYRYRGPLRIDGSTPQETRLSEIPTTIPEADLWEWVPPQDYGPAGQVVRAVAFDGDLRSLVSTATYVVSDTPSELASLFITADPEDLFGYENGIYVPGQTYDEDSDEYDGHWMGAPANYQESTEVPAYLEFQEPTGRRGFALEGGIRIHGGWSRAHPLKSLRLYARKEYGRAAYFNYQVFPGSEVTSYKRLMVRSGQSLFRSHLQDSLIHRHLRDHLQVELLESRPVVHFINGEYWGIKHLQERFDQHYLDTVHGIDPEDAVILEGPMGYNYQLQSGTYSDAQEYRAIRDYVVRHNMADPEHYAYVARRLHLDSFIDYNIVRMYAGDGDGVTKHIALWRRRGEYDPDAESSWDGRWRWHTWDFDNSLLFVDNDTMTFYGNDRSQEEHDDALSLASEPIDPEDAPAYRDPENTELFANLIENQQFRNRFINRFADVLNTVLAPEVFLPTITAAAEELEAEMPRHIARWNYPVSAAYWQQQVEQHRSFVRERPGIQREHIIDYFSLRGWTIPRTADLEVRLPTGEEGSVRVNTVTLGEETPWVDADRVWLGRYFQGVPVELEAEPADEYQFVGWSADDSLADGASRRITIDPGTVDWIQPEFEPVAGE
ncbi:MAG: CotH kinase family protein [Alkalispirochaeta sp.]